MGSLDAPLVLGALQTLLAELFDGPAPDSSWVLHRGAGTELFVMLRGLSAKQASATPVPGRSTIAGHANHLRFSLELLNRWTRGENPFMDADWQGSWRVQTVSDEEWRDLLAALRAEADAWRDAVVAPREWEPIALTGALASAAHVAYHLGAIRQLAVLAAEP